MPEPPLPPLTALRTFEAAARLMSFTAAAAELAVTQTAVSHQVRQLEHHLGASLFHREPPHVRLTRVGQAWARELTPVFARLVDANRRLRARASTPKRPLVSVSVIPSFAARWLVPRLGRFLAAHPDVDVHISPNAALVDFAADPIDLGVRYGSGRYPGLMVERLAEDAFVVVCTPTLATKLTKPHDLTRHVLLADDEPNAWRRWFEASDVRGVAPVRETVLTDSSMVVEAAVHGQGVALARWALAADDLAAGRLVLPFPRVRRLPTGRVYTLVAARTARQRPEVAAFWKWIAAEAAVLRIPAQAGR